MGSHENVPAEWNFQCLALFECARTRYLEYTCSRQLGFLESHANILGRKYLRKSSQFLNMQAYGTRMCGNKEHVWMSIYISARIHAYMHICVCICIIFVQCPSTPLFGTSTTIGRLLKIIRLFCRI